MFARGVIVTGSRASLPNAADPQGAQRRDHTSLSPLMKGIRSSNNVVRNPDRMSMLYAIRFWSHSEGSQRLQHGVLAA